ncbi:uncharacterized protein CANTADRAFT_24442 [Suhomyces tanzawaensis NRRL Y-17324]|uniref:Helicase C-terminal domain-containing protein n=1 Tax=Suhomyces tanzawaensis NRRL Y-17324 TaxID=984487 RepID=A0A1E4SPT0_9ASCO|nr:uncharacterized protein CANTADRAFT_24442 [Suhomyces tanzawaensis NRRL Y-17324]ODV81531.1 hypothetical protein CANTADRAFT_24442 [Suhomyces tanzawaensis NRRL Y-17324]
MSQPGQPLTLIQRIALLSNDFNNLVPVGSLQICNLPSGIEIGGGLPITDDVPLERNSKSLGSLTASSKTKSMSTRMKLKVEKLEIISYSSKDQNDQVIDPNDGEYTWKWLDLNFMDPDTIAQANPIIADLFYLINLRFIMATYRIINVKIDVKNSFPVCIVRVYVIPSDILGARYFDEWKLSRPGSLKLEVNYKKAWTRLLCFLDYSASGWKSTQEISSFNIKSLIDFRGFCEPDSPSFHISRWKNNEEYRKNNDPVSERNIKTPLLNVIQDLYDQLQSPEISEYTDEIAKPANSNIPHVRDIIIKLVGNAKEGTSLVRGIKSTLYPFQARSLAKMLEKESVPTRALVPNLIELESPTSKKYYYDLISCKFYNTPEMYDLPRGGILAENMGLGKTLICLSLICLTNHEVSQIPENMLLYKEESTSLKQVPSLATLCKTSINQNSLPWRYFKSDLPDSIIAQLNNSSGTFKISLTSNEYESPFVLRTRKSSSRQQLFQQHLPEEGRLFRSLLLCNTTLVIVPDNLLNQWNAEMKKHVQKDFLNILFLSNQFKKPIQTSSLLYTNQIPSDPKELIKHDVIFSTNSFISKQIDNGTENPLTKVYWKRMIIDEGHSLSSKVSRISFLCRTMHSERRWAVTGTPTSGLTRLHMDEQEESNNNDLPRKISKYTVKNSFNEKDDLNKLGTIIANFLKIEPFHSQSKYWTSQIIKPLERGLFGSNLNLLNLLKAIIVRHNLKDVESELQLPQLHHEAVFLEPSYHNKLSVNLFTAVLAVNAVSSERKDIDYMFHPNNAQQLRRLILNLQRATFHWTGFKQEDVELLIEVCEKSMKKNEELGGTVYNEYDLQLLVKSVKASKDALRNSRWRTSALLHEMPYFVKGLSQEFVRAFGVGSTSKDINIFGAPHLHQIQEFYYKNRFMNMEDKDDLAGKLEAVSSPFWKSYWEDNLKRNNEKFNKQDKNQQFDGNLKKSIKNAVDIPSVVKVLEEINPKSLGDEAKKINDGQGFLKNLKDTEILGTASSKLSYLSSRLLEHQRQNVKSLVFFEFEDSAYYLTELLDVLGVNYILYATFINSAERARNLTEFSSYDSKALGGISLIMDLKLASHGLTIIAATHVYFISPVWRRSVEAQAIKRAHRIGQTQEVFVETLVLKGTLEEEIYKRRSRDEEDGLDNERDTQKRYVIDDTGMQNYILKHEFLPHDEDAVEFATFNALSLNGNVGNSDVDEYSLKEHKDQITQTDHGIMRTWKVFLFNENNLAKLNKIKAEKVKRDFMRDSNGEDLIGEEVQISRKFTHKENDPRPPRKKVRF